MIRILSILLLEAALATSALMVIRGKILEHGLTPALGGALAAIALLAAGAGYATAQFVGRERR